MLENMHMGNRAIPYTKEPILKRGLSVMQNEFLHSKPSAHIPLHAEGDPFWFAKQSNLFLAVQNESREASKAYWLGILVLVFGFRLATNLSIALPT